MDNYSSIESAQKSRYYVLRTNTTSFGVGTFITRILHIFDFMLHAGWQKMAWHKS